MLYLRHFSDNSLRNSRIMGIVLFGIYGKVNPAREGEQQTSAKREHKKNTRVLPRAPYHGMNHEHVLRYFFR
jgi:hypothetical protein